MEQNTNSQPHHVYGNLPEITRWIIEIICVISLAVFVVWSFGLRVRIAGHSMEPRLEDGDVVLIDRLGSEFRDIRRFDIVAFSYGDDRSVTVKRVVGLPGETVQIKGGQVYIDGSIMTLSEQMGSYTVAGLAEDEIELSEGMYFLLGDNGDSSDDSRFNAVGCVNIEDIEGLIWFRIAPFKRLGRIR